MIPSSKMRANRSTPTARMSGRQLNAQGRRGRGWRRFMALAAVSAALALPAHAEKFLSVAEAQKIFFPAADKFEAETIRFTAEQRSAIARKIRGRVLNQGQRYWLAREGTNLLGLVVLDHVLGKHELIDYAVALDPAGKILAVEILEYRESHGSEITSQKWRNQFLGKTGEAPLRLNADIYNISGATISCRAVTDGIRRVVATYELLIRPQLRDPESRPAN